MGRNYILLLAIIFILTASIGCVRQHQKEYVFFETMVVDTYDEERTEAYQEDNYHYSKIRYEGKEFDIQTGNSYVYISYSGIRGNETHLEGFETQAGSGITVEAIYDGNVLFVLAVYNKTGLAQPNREYITFDTEVGSVVEDGIGTYSAQFSYNGQIYNFTRGSLITCRVMAQDTEELTSKGFEVLHVPDEPAFYPFTVRLDDPLKPEVGDDISIEGVFDQNTNKLAPLFISTGEGGIKRSHYMDLEIIHDGVKKYWPRHYEEMQDGVVIGRPYFYFDWRLVEDASLGSDEKDTCELIGGYS